MSTKASKLKIEYLNIDEIKPYPNNPRKNDGAVDAVANSIAEFGFKVPIVVDKDKVIIAGHTRLKAAEKLGLTSVPVISADDLTDEQVKAFRLADNKTAELAEWDELKLDEELAEVADIDMSAFGFEIGSFGNTDIKMDDFDPAEVDEKPETRPGDIYILGDHRLICGDATDKNTADIVMGGGIGGNGFYRSSLWRRNR